VDRGEWERGSEIARVSAISAVTIGTDCWRLRVGGVERTWWWDEE
jgi:hypothetical protein